MHVIIFESNLTNRKKSVLLTFTNLAQQKKLYLDSRVKVAPGINVATEKFGKNNRCRPLNKPTHFYAT